MFFQSQQILYKLGIVMYSFIWWFEYHKIKRDKNRLEKQPHCNWSREKINKQENEANESKKRKNLVDFFLWIFQWLYNRWLTRRETRRRIRQIKSIYSGWQHWKHNWSVALCIGILYERCSWWRNWR